MRLLLQLYGAFFRIGILTFGGGYAMLPMLTRECVERYGWSTEDELLDYYAIGQCTPGVIAVNTATFIGSKIGGFWGALSATLGVISPSYIIISAIACFLQQFESLSAVQHAFGGIRVAVCALVLNAFWGIAKKGIVDKLTFALLVGAFVLMYFVGLSPIPIVLLAAAAGILAKRAVAK